MSLLSLSSSVFLSLFKEWITYKDILLLYQSLSKEDRRVFVKVAIIKDNGTAILKSRGAEFVSWEESQWLLNQFGIVAKSKITIEGGKVGEKLPTQFVEWNLDSALKKDHVNVFEDWSGLERIHIKCTGVKSFNFAVDLFAMRQGRCSIRVHNEQYDWSVTYDASKKSLRFYKIDAPSAELIMAAITEVRTMLVYCKSDNESNYLKAFKKYADTLEELLIDEGELPAARLADFPNLTSLTAHKVTGSMEMGALRVIKLYRLQYENGFLSVGMEDEPQQLAALLSLSQQFPVRKLKLMRELSVQETELLLGHREQLEELEVQYCDCARLTEPLRRIVACCALKEVRLGYVSLQEVEHILNSLVGGPSRASLTSIHLTMRFYDEGMVTAFALTPYCAVLPQFTSLTSFGVTYNSSLYNGKATMTDVASLVDLLSPLPALTQVVFRDLIDYNTLFIRDEETVSFLHRIPHAWWKRIAISAAHLSEEGVAVLQSTLQARTLPFEIVSCREFDVFQYANVPLPAVTAVNGLSHMNLLLLPAVWEKMLCNWKSLHTVEIPLWTVRKKTREMTVRVERKPDYVCADPLPKDWKKYFYSVASCITSHIQLRHVTLELIFENDATAVAEAILPLFASLKTLKIVYFASPGIAFWKRLASFLPTGLERLTLLGEPVAASVTRVVELLNRDRPALAVTWGEYAF